MSSYIGNEPGGLGKAERFIFTATGTTPTITHDTNGVPISYTPSQVSVYLNGVKQVVGTDVTCTNGSSVVFAANLVVGDVVEVIALSTFTATSVDSSSIVSGAIDLAHMSVNSIDSDQYVDGSIDLAHMSSESVDEDNLQISNAGTNGQFLSKQSGNAGGLTWAAAGGNTVQTVVVTRALADGDATYTTTSATGGTVITTGTGSGQGDLSITGFSASSGNVLSVTWQAGKVNDTGAGYAILGVKVDSTIYAATQTSYTPQGGGNAICNVSYVLPGALSGVTIAAWIASPNSEAKTVWMYDYNSYYTSEWRMIVQEFKQ